MSESFSQMVPFELGKVFQIPYILGVEIAFFTHHFLAIESQGRKFGHSFILKLDPSLPEAYLFTASSFDSILSGPITLRQKIYPFDRIALQQSSEVSRLHVWRYP